jgi:ankyrin repeat protein
LAALKGHVECAKQFLMLGADVNAAEDLASASPLHYAAAGGHMEVLLSSCPL